MSFASFALDEKIIQAVSELAYRNPTPIQQQVIPLILAKRDVMARAKTGTGKTAAFSLPLIDSILRKERSPYIKTLVLTPTRELAQQVYDNIISYSKNTDIRVSKIHGGISSKPQLGKIKQGADILVATPGRLLDHLRSQEIDLSKLTSIVFDEADRMLDLGFKEEISEIRKYANCVKQTLLFSATFTSDVYKMAKQLLKNEALVEIDEHNALANNIKQTVYTVDENRKRELLSYLIGKNNWQQVLVFTRSKKAADNLVVELVKDGLNAKAMHGDKSQAARNKALEEFKTDQLRVLVATDVAARGIDINQLNYVINYELPHQAEDYIHRVGRTARAGNSGIAISLVSAKEVWLIDAIEKITDQRLMQQWYPGFEPDLTAELTSPSKLNKKSARQSALGKKKSKKHSYSRSKNSRR